MTAGLYVHVPFCASKCRYCDFNSYLADRTAVESYLRAVRLEMALYSTWSELDEARFTTLYVGGGTPTILPPAELAELVAAARSFARLGPRSEVTVEANPGTVDASGLARLKAAGANRLSLGVQSFRPELLRVLGRIHTVDDIVAGFEAARNAGFRNVNLDLMFGLPGQTLAQFQQTVERALELGPEHLSCYSLIIEDGTPFAFMHEAGRLALPDEDIQLAMYQWAIARLVQAGYEHYEVSNFALPGRRCQHNETYWRNEWYLGLGPGSHSHWGSERFANVHKPAEYSRTLRQGELPVAERFSLSCIEQMDETLMMSMRLLGGISEERFVRRFGKRLSQEYGPQIESLVNLGLVTYDGKVLRLSRKGLFLGNQVFGAFLRSS